MASITDKINAEIERRKKERAKNYLKCGLMEYSINNLDVAVQILSDDGDIREFVNEYIVNLEQRRQNSNEVYTAVITNLACTLPNYNKATRQKWEAIYYELLEGRF